MSQFFQFKFWNDPVRLYRQSFHQSIMKSAACPGHIGDPNDRGQPGRFDKWHKLPEKAWKLYWRFHKQ